MAVHLTRIYTRTGDAGSTRLGDMSKTTKTDSRVAAYGDVNEANAVIGLARATGVPSRLDEILAHVQNELFDVGADLSTPVVAESKYPPLRIQGPAVDRLESWIDALNADLEALASFILPGGTLASSHLHIACTTVRRAERSTWAAAGEHGTEGEGSINPVALRYLNRLSDLLFVAARWANLPENGGAGDVLWQPGSGDRSAPD